MFQKLRLSSLAVCCWRSLPSAVCCCQGWCTRSFVCLLVCYPAFCSPAQPKDSLGWIPEPPRQALPLGHAQRTLPPRLLVPNPSTLPSSSALTPFPSSSAASLPSLCAPFFLPALFPASLPPPPSLCPPPSLLSPFYSSVFHTPLFTPGLIPGSLSLASLFSPITSSFSSHGCLIPSPPAPCPFLLPLHHLLHALPSRLLSPSVPPLCSVS